MVEDFIRRRELGNYFAAEDAMMMRMIKMAYLDLIAYIRDSFSAR